MSEVKKVIKVFEDGAYEDVEHGVLIECNGDDFNLQFMDVSPMNMCRAAIGLVEGIKSLDLKNSWMSYLPSMLTRKSRR